MKEATKLKLMELLNECITYKDGFFIYKDKKIITEEELRGYIKRQISILEKDVTEIISEITFNKNKSFDVDKYFTNKLLNLASQSTSKSKYLEDLDKLYPNNKFREIINYYLFSDEFYSFIFVGYGMTGKTTFVQLISEIIGMDFFGRGNVKLLKSSYGTSILEGKKFFEVAEAQDLDIDTANFLKSIITNDSVFINPKFQQPRTFKPHVKMIMTCNSLPRFKVVDDGIIRRFIIVKMNTKVRRQDKHYLDNLKEDIPNIIKEALEHPFDISHFAEEQFEFFLNDPQYGFGYGVKKAEDQWYEGRNEYEKYKRKCEYCGNRPRSKQMFLKTIELANIYKERLQENEEQCFISDLSDLTVRNGSKQSVDFTDDDLPF